jgi:hypothetical protein
MDIRDLPEEKYKQRGYFLKDSIPNIIGETVKFIETSYDKSDLLEEATFFIAYDLMDGQKGDIMSLSRCGFFPFSEASFEMDKAQSLIFTGFYKHSFDAMRRALELLVIGIWFMSAHKTNKDAKEWFLSKCDTPQFSKIIRKLATSGIWALIDNKLDWVKVLLECYWNLSDKIHTKGFGASHHKLNPVRSTVNSISVPTFDSKSCLNAFTAYLETVGHMAILICADNPNLLVGFDLSRKFGFNEPICGLFYPGQTERTLNLMPSDFRTFFIEYAKSSDECKSFTNWLEDYPDITEEKLKDQQEEWEKTMQENFSHKD